MRKLIFTLLLLITNYGWSQHFSYRFNGTISSEQQTLFVSKVQQMETFSEVKFRLKEDKGEVFFYMQEQKERGEQEPAHTIIAIKSLLIEFGLEPSDIVQLEN